MGIFQGVWHFQKKKIGKKEPPPQPKSCFDNTMGNTFSGTLFFGQNADRNFFRTVNI